MQDAQNVHSKLQIRASDDSGGRAVEQRSHAGLSSSMPTIIPERGLAGNDERRTIPATGPVKLLG